ncbi:amidase family protein [Paracoccus yeei]|uniref:amidase family protein n=1 Tax=Paracoccus yeei TaxID=147645 RepID=UPI003BF829B0
MDPSDSGVGLAGQKAKIWWSPVRGVLAEPRVLCQSLQITARKNNGRVGSSANQCSGLRFVTGSGLAPYSEKAVAGTTQRCAAPSQRRRCGLAVLRMFVTPVSGASGTLKNCSGVGGPAAGRVIRVEAGDDTEETTLPVDALAFLDSVFTIIGAQTRSLLDSFARHSGRPVDETQLDPVETVVMRDKGGVRGADYAAAVDALHAPGKRMEAVFQDYDLPLTPAPPIGAPRIRMGSSLRQYIELSHSYSPFTPIFNASGQPATSVPLFWTPAGLPTGAHFAAPFGTERRLFALAAQPEEARPWAGRLPPVRAA